MLNILAYIVLVLMRQKNKQLIKFKIAFLIYAYSGIVYTYKYMRLSLKIYVQLLYIYYNYKNDAKTTKTHFASHKNKTKCLYSKLEILLFKFGTKHRQSTLLFSI